MPIRTTARIAMVSLIAMAFMAPAHAQLRISQVGKGAGTNVNAFEAQFIELYNAGPVDVSLEGKSIQWASVAGSASWTKIDLHGSISAGGYWLIRTTGTRSFGVPFSPDQDRPVGFNGLPFSSVTYGDGAGKVVLADTTAPFTTNGCAAPDAAHVLDMVSWDDEASTAMCHEGSACALIPRLAGVGSTAVLRRCGGETDTDDNLNDFVVTARPPRNSSYSGSPLSPAVSGITQVTGQSGLGTATGYAGQTVLFTSVPTTCAGTVTGVTIDLAPIGGSAAQVMFDNGMNGDEVADDGVYSYLYTIPSSSSAPLDTYALVISATDSIGLTGTGLAPMTIAPTPPLNDLCGNAEVIPATALPVNVSVTGNLVSAGPINQINVECASAAGPGTSRDVWYSFTPVESAYYTVTTCNEVTAPGLFTSMATNLTIFASCPADDETDLIHFSIACNSNGCTNFIGGGPSTIGVYPMFEDVPYFIRVARYGSGDGVVGATFRLDITSEPFGACCLANGTCKTIKETACMALSGTPWGDDTTCSTTVCPPPPPPVNDDCANAVTLTPSVPEPGTSYGATGTDITTCDQTSWDSWYLFTPSSAAPVQFTATLVAGAQTPAIAVFDACPPVVDANLVCSAVPSSGSVNTLVFEGVPGTPYYVRVATNFSQRSEFTVVVENICVAADGDFDGDVDLADYAALESCLNGPAGAMGPGCACYDLDADADVDLSDFAGFQLLYGG